MKSVEFKNACVCSFDEELQDIDTIDTNDQSSHTMKMNRL